MAYNKSRGSKGTAGDTALPPLKPNQPNQSRPAPNITMGMLLGSIGSFSLNPFPTTGQLAGQRPRADMGDHPPGSQVPPPEPAAYPPHPMGDRIIDDGEPKDENQVGAELGPFDDAAGKEGGCDNSEHGLIDHEGMMRHGGRVVGEGIEPHTSEPDPVKSADDVAEIGPKGDAVTIECPVDPDDPPGR